MLVLFTGLYAMWQNLRRAAGVVGKVRPGSPLIVDLLLNHDRALLVSPLGPTAARLAVMLK